MIGQGPLNNDLFPIYTEFPKGARGFLDLYRSFAFQLDPEWLVDAYLEITTSKDGSRLERDLMLASPDLSTGLKMLATGTAQEQLLVIRWVRGEALPASEFRKVGISRKIGSAEEATSLITAIVGLLRTAALLRGKPGCNVVWLIDEFQRVERTGKKTLEEVNAGLHSTFNSLPNSLALFLSFSDKPKDHLPPWFSPELRDRIGPTRIMILPPMQTQEAKIFIADVLAHFRSDGNSANNAYSPFTEDACDAIIQKIRMQADLKPRHLMGAFSAVLEQAEPRFLEGSMKAIDKRFVDDALREYVFLEESEDQA